MSDQQAVTFKGIVDSSAFTSGIQQMITATEQFQQQLTNVSNTMKTAFTGAGPQIGQIAQQERQWSNETLNLSQSHRTLGQSLKDNALAIGVTASSVVGLITQFHGLEAAHVALERAQYRQSTAAFAVQKAQEKLANDLAKYGPASKQVADDETNLANKREALRVQTERVGVSQTNYNDALLSFATNVGPQLIQIGAGIVSMFSNMRGSQMLAAAANSVFTASSAGAAGGAIAVADADLMLAGAEDVASASAMGLATRLALIAVPVAVVAAAIALLGTNAFGAADAFKAALLQIGKSLDALLLGINQTVGIFQQAFGALPGWFTGNVVKPLTDAWAALENFLNKFTADPWGAMWAVFKAVPENFKKYIVDPIAGYFAALQNATKPGSQIAGFLPAGTPQLKVPQVAFAPGFDPTKFGPQGPGAGTITGVGAAGGMEGLAILQSRFGQVPGGGGQPGIFTQMTKAIGDNTVAVSQWLVKLATGKISIADFIAGVEKSIPGLKGMIGGLLGGSQAADAAAAATGKAGAAAAEQSENYKKLTDDINKNAKEITLRTQEMTSGDEFQKQYTAGVQAADLALLNLNDANVNARGTIERTNQQIQNGSFIMANYQKGVIDTGKAYDDAVAKLAQLDGQLNNSTAILNRHNTAIVQGKVNFEQLLITTQDNVTTQQEYNALLDKSVGSFGLFGGALEKTTKNMETVAKAALGDKDALAELNKGVQDLYNWFFKLGDEVGSKLGDALDKGGKSFKKAVKDLTKETGADFKDLGEVPALRMEAGMQQAEKTLKTDLGAMAVLIRQNAPNIGAATDEMILKLQDQIGNAAPGIEAQWQKIFTDMRTIANDPSLRSTQAINALADLKNNMDSLGVPTADVTNLLGGFAQKLLATGRALDAVKLLPFSDAAVAAAGALTAMGNSVDKATGVVRNAQGQIVGYVNKVSGSFDDLSHSSASAASSIVADWNKVASDMATISKRMQATLASMTAPAAVKGVAGEAGAGALGVISGLKQPMPAVPTGGPLGGISASTIDGLSKSMSTLNAVLVNTGKDLSLVNSVAVNTSKDFSLVNSVILNTSKDLSLANAVIVNTSKDLSEANSVSVNSSKDFSTLNDVIVNTSKDFSLANAVLVNTSRDLNAVNTSAGTATSSLGRLASEIGSALVNAMNSANRVLSNLSSNLNHVGSSAGSAAGQVSRLASAINSLHDKTVTVTYRQVGSPTGFQHGFHGTISGPMAFIAGEAGPERVDVTPVGSTTTTTATAASFGTPIVRQDQGPTTACINLNVYLDSSRIMTQSFQQVLVRRVATAAG